MESLRVYAVIIGVCLFDCEGLRDTETQRHLRNEVCADRLLLSGEFADEIEIRAIGGIKRRTGKPI